MDASSFDRLSRLAAVSSRRAVTTGLVGALAGLLGGAAPVAAAPCKKGKKRCRGKCIPKQHCCTSGQCRPQGSGKVCVRGTCGCPTGQSLCDGVCTVAGACCVDVTCDPVANGTSVCEEGTCVLTCDPTFAECGGACLPNGTCCVGVTCEPVANAATGCVDGDCVITSCNGDFANCNGIDADGCEIDLDTDAANCGACGSPCNPQPPTSCGRNGTCAGGTCQRYAAETTCRPASCDGFSTRRLAAVCTGTGDPCPASATENCAPYACDDSSGTCVTNCQNNDNRCERETHFCDGTICEPKRAAGRVCGRPAVCDSGVCDLVTQYCCPPGCNVGAPCGFAGGGIRRCRAGGDCFCVQ